MVFHLEGLEGEALEHSEDRSDVQIVGHVIHKGFFFILKENVFGLYHSVIIEMPAI